MIAAVLAAGESQRFGRRKQVEPIDGIPMIERVIRSLPENLEVIVITGANEDLIKKTTEHLNVTFITNKNYKSGLGTSVKCAASYALEKNSPLLITLADLPFVEVNEYQSLINNLKDLPVFSNFQKQLGPPAVFPVESLATLQTIEDNRGAKSVFKDVESVPIENAQRDIDYPQDI